MSVLFFIPLVVITFFESHLDVTKSRFMRSMLEAAEEGEEQDPANQNPEIGGGGEHDGKEICKVQFEELVKSFPDVSLVSFYSRFRFCFCGA